MIFNVLIIVIKCCSFWFIVLDFPCSSVGKRICLQCRRPGFDPWVGKSSWSWKWQPTPVFLPGKSHGQGSLAGYCPWGHKEPNTTELLSTVDAPQTWFVLAVPVATSMLGTPLPTALPAPHPQVLTAAPGRHLLSARRKCARISGAGSVTTWGLRIQ